MVSIDMHQRKFYLSFFECPARWLILRQSRHRHSWWPRGTPV